MRAFGTDGTVGNWAALGDFLIASSDTNAANLLLSKDELLSVLKQLNEDILTVVSQKKSQTSASVPFTAQRETETDIRETERSKLELNQAATSITQTTTFAPDLMIDSENFQSLDYLLSQLDSLEWNV